jgi:hypothetical protein
MGGEGSRGPGGETREEWEVEKARGEGEEEGEAEEEGKEEREEAEGGKGFWRKAAILRAEWEKASSWKLS